jgi:hypothetical protein
MNARQNLRLTIHEFLLTATCEEDEEVWKRNLKTYDDLLAEVKRLREENELLKIRLDREERYVQLLHHEFFEEQKLMFTDEFNEKVSEIYEPQDGGEEE